MGQTIRLKYWIFDFLHHTAVLFILKNRSLTQK
jgi:hypothetical protein